MQKELSERAAALRAQAAQKAQAANDYTSIRSVYQGEILPTLLSTEDTAALLGISKTTLWRRIRDGTVPPPVRFGPSVRHVTAGILSVVDRLIAERDAGKRPKPKAIHNGTGGTK